MTRDDFQDKAKTPGNADTQGKKDGAARSVIHISAPRLAGPRAPAPRPSFASGMPMAMNIRPLAPLVPDESATANKISLFTRVEVDKE